MKLLICGANGQLGHDCVKVFSDTHEFTTIDIDKLDITDTNAVNDHVKKERPQIIINCAAFTDVDGCETDHKTAFAVNAAGPENLARAARDTGGRLIHISTDYVFDGTRPLPEAYSEEDEPNPVSVYGRSKLAGERAVMAAGKENVVVRTAWLYGINGNNFLKTILSMALKNPCKPVRVVADQFGSPTWSRTLAIQLKTMVKHNARGLYHATSDGYCSWHDLALYFLKKMGVLHAVEPCSTDEYPRPAARPKNSILENRKLKEEDIDEMRFWKDDIDDFVESYRQQLLEECSPATFMS